MNNKSLLPSAQSPRESFTSSSTFQSDMFTVSSLSSIDTPSGSSSAFNFINDSIMMDGTPDFDMVDGLDDIVDESLLDHEYVHRKREMVVNTLIRSEESYTNSLRLVKQTFLDPLKSTKHSTFGFLGIKKTICTEREHRWLFGNYQELIQLHEATLSSLQERLQIWGPTQILSDIFQSWIPRLELYRVYFNNYDMSLSTYDRLLRYQPFKKFLDTLQKDKKSKETHLLTLLQLPATCVPRYVEIISQLSDLTPTMHPDHVGLMKCKQWVIKLKQSMQERLRDAHNVDKVLKIHQSFVDAPINVRAERRLVLQGNLYRVMTNSSPEERRCILFTDLLVFAKPVDQKEDTQLLYRDHLTLDRARVRALTKQDMGMQHCIEIQPSISGIDNLNTTFVGISSTVVLCASSEEEQKSWIGGLNFVIHHLNKIATMKQAQATQRRIQERMGKNGSNK